MSIGTAADVLTGVTDYNKSYVDITAAYTVDIQTSKIWMLNILNCLINLIC